MTATKTRGCVSNGSVQLSSQVVRKNRFSNFKTLALAVALTGFASLSADPVQALDVNVTNYSWLQGPASTAVPFIGSANNLTGSSFGEVSDFRWGDYVWLPTTTMTNSGADMYYAGIMLDQPRMIDNVKLQWWTNGGNTATQYHIDGSNDGTNWTNMTTQPVGFGAVDRVVTNVAVTPAAYQYVRVRFEGPDYESGASYGGPGFLLIEPSGSGAISGDKVNWANAQFGTTVVNTNMPVYNSTIYNDGTLEERSGTDKWTGTQDNWNTLSPNAYTTLSLGQARLISEAVAIWGHDYNGNAFDIEYSVNGTNFFSVANPVTTQASTTYKIGATGQTFNPVIANYIRMRNASGPNGYTLLNQLLLHSPTEGILTSDVVANGTISMSAGAEASTGTLNDAVTLENTGVTGSAIGVFGYTITGLNAAEFSLANFSQLILMDGDEFSYDINFNAPVAGTYSALLSFNTSVGVLSFNLEASAAPAPEPSTALLLGLGCLIPLVRRKRS